MTELISASTGQTWNEELPPPRLTKNAVTILERRYLRRDDAGKVVETPPELFARVAHYLATPEVKYGGDSGAMARSFYNMMANMDFLPNSPTFTGAGNPLGQLAACFVLPVGDSLANIFDSIKHAALIHQGGGGTGMAFSRLRPKDDLVMSTKGIASGPVSFMEVFNAATEAIKQGGVRFV